MGLTLSQRKALTGQTAARCRGSTKKQKGMTLDEFVAATDHGRKYAGWILRNWGKKRIVRLDGELVEFVAGRPRKERRKPRERVYDRAVCQALKKVWVMFDCLCGKRLVVVLRTMLPIVIKFRGIELTQEVRNKLEHISAATVVEPRII